LAKKQYSAASSKRRRGLEHVDLEVGANLRQYRIRAGLSQEALGAKIGVTFQQVQKYEKGTNAIATARLPAICQVLSISPNDLYGSLFKSGKAREPAPQLSPSPSNWLSPSIGFQGENEWLSPASSRL
jgi:transcriptional regulator with XRE-family HTH domain